MEEQVKARLIGATVLVVIAVALVPELLSGPRRHGDEAGDGAGRRGTRTYTIDLSGGAEGKAGPPTASPVESRGSTARLPAVAPPGAAAVAQAQPSSNAAEPEAVPEPASAPVAAPVATPTPTPGPMPPVTQAATARSTTGGWAVQVGAFGSAVTARNLVTDLERDGYAAYIAPLTRSGKTLHRVRVGPEPVRADADRLAGRLKGKGLPASVVPAD